MTHEYDCRCVYKEEGTPHHVYRSDIKAPQGVRTVFHQCRSCCSCNGTRPERKPNPKYTPEGYR